MQAGVHLLFTPAVADLYPYGVETSTYVKVPQLSDILCGVTRPGHFMGVATVVSKLFNLAQPDKALFGQKDYQQWLVIQRMVADLWMPITLLSVPTVREQDGLAMSSRNRYLNTQERVIAPYLFKTLNEIRSHLIAGQRNFYQLEVQAHAQLAALGFKPDYVSIRDATDLAVPTSATHTWAVLAAAYLGQARLIDNVCFDI
jgi:pantoate--beta-alanine ligase